MSPAAVTYRPIAGAKIKDHIMNTATTTPVSERDIFLQQLREGTSYWHQQLEDLEPSKAILGEAVSREQYTHYLKTMYGFVRPFETIVYPQLSLLIPDIEDRRKTALLEKDLELLGLAKPEIAQIPLCPIPADLQAAQAMGRMYVIEGSTLGGAVIYKHIHKILGIDAESGAAYFQPYGQQAGTYWKAFVNNMAAFALEQKKEQELIVAATETFREIHDWFLHS